MNSVWSEMVSLPKFQKLRGDKKTNVLIIGGGMAGILCAYLLEEAGVPYILAEAEEICGGITKNTTAKITVQHALIYNDLINKVGIEKSKMYFEANTAALKKYFEICHNTECDFEKKDAFVYSLNNRGKLEQEIKAIERLGGRAEFNEKVSLPFNICGAVRMKNQAQFNPLKFIDSIVRGMNIYEHTPVIEIKEHGAITDEGRITAEKIIVATHFPFINKHGSYFVKMYQSRSYVIGLENAAQVDGMYIDEKENGMSFRNYKNLLLLGGGSHRTGKQGGCWQELENFANRFYPQAEIKYRWATQDCMTLDSIPYIGQYSAITPDLYVASGFNKWGMTSSMAAAMILRDMVLEKDNPYSSVFSPSRSIIKPQLAVNAFEAVTSLLTPSQKRCPHLGCSLKWNKNEHSWDCPCHGSRFSEDGKLLDNPSTGNLK